MIDEVPCGIFAKIVDRESLYNQGTIILGVHDESLNTLQQDFKRCYDLWLGLGNGFSDVCAGTWLSSMPRAVSAFDRTGSELVAQAGRKVLDEFSRRGIVVTEEGIEMSMGDQDDETLTSLFEAVRDIDTEYIEGIWSSDVESVLIELAREAAG